MSNVGKLVYLGGHMNGVLRLRFSSGFGIIYRETGREFYLWHLVRKRKIRWDKRNEYKIIEGG